MVFREAAAGDYSDILRLNEELVHWLSPMDEAILAKLHAQSALTAVIEEDSKVAAFMIILRECKDYDSENYRWFSARYPQFLYVDRIVVAPHYHRRGYGRFLYDKLFLLAKRDGIPFVTAEVNIEPLNQVSLDFHRWAGFEEVGTQWLMEGSKRVCMLLAEIK